MKPLMQAKKFLLLPLLFMISANLYGKQPNIHLVMTVRNTKTMVEYNFTGDLELDVKNNVVTGKLPWHMGSLDHVTYGRMHASYAARMNMTTQDAISGSYDPSSGQLKLHCMNYTGDADALVSHNEYDLILATYEAGADNGPVLLRSIKGRNGEIYQIIKGNYVISGYTQPAPQGNNNSYNAAANNNGQSGQQVSKHQEFINEMHQMRKESDEYGEQIRKTLHKYMTKQELAQDATLEAQKKKAAAQENWKLWAELDKQENTLYDTVNERIPH